MRRREKTSIVAVTVLIVVILGALAMLGVVPRQQKVFAVAQPASEVAAVSAPALATASPNSAPSIYRQQAEIDKLNALVGDKTATRVFHIFGKGNSFDAAVTSNNDKASGYSVDAQGRVLFLVDKGDIRNKSLLHSLWWKINSLYDKSSAVEYVTDPDEVIAIQVKVMLEHAAQAQ